MMSMVIGGSLPSVSNTYSSVASTYSSSQNFAATFGAEHPRRTLFIATYRPTVTAVTVAGVPATLLLSNGPMKLWRADVTTGTSGTINVASSGGAYGAFITVWAAYHLKSATPYATATKFDDSNVGTTTCNVNVQDHGIIISMAATSTTGISSASWSGLIESSEIKNGATLATAAEAQRLSAATPYGVSVSWNVSSLGTMISAAFR